MLQKFVNFEVFKNLPIPKCFVLLAPAPNASQNEREDKELFILRATADSFIAIITKACTKTE